VFVVGCARGGLVAGGNKSASITLGLVSAVGEEEREELLGYYMRLCGTRVS